MTSDDGGSRIKRRTFLGAGACALAALGVGTTTGLRFLAEADEGDEVSAAVRGTREVLSVCANCVNKCGIKARVVDGRHTGQRPSHVTVGRDRAEGSGAFGDDRDTATGEFVTTIYVGGAQVQQFSGTIESYRQ